MQLVIFAGGLGTRMGQETALRPKPMLDIGGMPILWHIMMYYSKFGIKNFIVLAGHRSIEIKKFFRDLRLYGSNVLFEATGNEFEPNNTNIFDWRVRVLDTGPSAETGYRLYQAKSYITDPNFFCTYGDGLANVNLNELISFHKQHKGAATVSTVRPQSRFGELKFDQSGKVTSFLEKPILDNFVNIGFMCFSSRVFDFMNDSNEPLETGLLARLVDRDELFGYVHNGAWKPIDNPRELAELEDIWSKGEAWWT
jgi:glucose-1-phosphate cytidylyltransferase